MTMKKSLQAALAAFVFVCAALPLAATGSADQGGKTVQSYTIEVAGSTSVSPLMEKLGAAYHGAHPEITVNVNGTGSSDGIKAANQKTSELGMSSRNLKAAEKGYGLTELVIAVDAIAAIVHPANPVSNLTVEQIKGIYTGKIKNWKDVGGKNSPIAVVSREPGSGTRGAFEEIIGFVDQLVLGAAEFDGTGGVRAAVAGNENAIGYISLGSMDPQVKAISVDGVAATKQNVVNGSFKIARPFLVLYHQDNLSAEGKKFLDWTMSPEGQKIAGTNWIAVK
jgi:phosphate transport system substrate-binding protein